MRSAMSKKMISEWSIGGAIVATWSLIIGGIVQSQTTESRKASVNSISTHQDNLAEQLSQMTNST